MSGSYLASLTEGHTEYFYSCGVHTYWSVAGATPSVGAGLIAGGTPSLGAVDCWPVVLFVV
jgi:hypothetical protein